MKTLIVGRTASGKDTLAKKLEITGKTGVTSYTTRPRRDGEGDTHIFITPEQAEEYTPDKRAATTTINGYEYFSTYDQIKKADWYIIDPVGAVNLMKNMPDETFAIMYLTPMVSQFSTPDAHFETLNTKEAIAMRRDAYRKREPDNKDIDAEFEERDKAESKQFDAFEYQITHRDLSKNPDNMAGIQVYPNDYSEETIERYAMSIVVSLKLVSRIGGMLMHSARKHSMFPLNENTGEIRVNVKDKDGKTGNEWTKPEMFAFNVINDGNPAHPNPAFDHFMRTLIMECDAFDGFSAETNDSLAAVMETNDKEPESISTPSMQ